MRRIGARIRVGSIRNARAKRIHPPPANPRKRQRAKGSQQANKPNAGKLQGGKILTQHTGLPPKPRADGSGKPKPTGKPKQRGR